MKIVIDPKGRKYLLKKELNTNYGLIREKNVKNHEVISSTGVKFKVLEPSFSDLFEFIKRGPQIITLKDASAIGRYLNLKPNYKIVDVGTGSGALAIYLSTLVPSGEVVTYEKRKDFFNIAKKNIELFGKKNIKIKLKDATKTKLEKADAMSVDIPNPWDLDFSNLKYGKYACVYLPTSEQVIKFRDSTNLHIEKIIEVKERNYKIKPFRPINTQLDFTGYIIVLRKI